MELCHHEEHENCSQYSSIKERKIEVVTLMKGETFQIYSEQNQMIYIMDGLLNLLSKKIYNKNVREGELMLIPLHRTCIMTAMKDSSIMVIRLDFNIIFCERLPLDLLLEKTTKGNEDAGIGLLKAHQKLIDFINIVNNHLMDGLDCPYYYDLKIREFLFLLRAYYDKKQIFTFFKPIYSGDFVFSSNIYKHLNNVRTVKEMANKINYSLSGFEKKFKRVFAVSPYQWMQEQRARKIYKEVTCTKKTFTEIAFEYEFSSPAHFNDFCKQYFQNTPGGLRKENEKRLMV
jgi:AraC-like DNA-binding protein